MIILSVLPLLLYVSNAQISCDAIIGEFACNTQSGDTCKWVGDPATGKCKCKSEVKLDILFGVDTSGSIGWSEFQIQKQFISTLVTQVLNNGSRIGFTMFGTEINESRTIQSWYVTSELEDYVDHIFWTTGWTNTPALIESMLDSFDSTKDPDRQQIFIMITDGNPCLSESRGGCPQSVCGQEFNVKNKGIRTIVIGVGDGLKRDYVDCLCIDKQEDFIHVASFSTNDFNSIMGSLSAVLCPVSKNCLVTEVKAMRRPLTWNVRGDGRFTRFLEIYNEGIDFTLDTLRLTGLVNMAAGPGGANAAIIAQGSYLVFYDAADLPVTADNTGIGPSVPSCHLCGSDCGLSSCNKGDYDYCFCSNAVYVRCGNAGGSSDSCPANVASTTDVNGASSENGCGVCTFNNNMDESNWDIQVTDATATAVIIDEVVYGANGWWFVTEPRYSYELTNLASDNNVGDSWASSCSPLGTPGAAPAATCDEYCTGNSCQAGAGGGICLPNGNCDCNPLTGYYPSCTPKGAGGVQCAQCLRWVKNGTTPMGDCDVLWVKNGTTRYAAFNWSATSFAGRYYKITYFRASDVFNPGVDTTDGVTYWTTTDYDPSNTSYGGYVQSCISHCVNINNDTHPIQRCDEFCSESTMCDIRTAAPTRSPSISPTDAPSTPTNIPTNIPSSTDPTNTPSINPTIEPTIIPIDVPSKTPSDMPSKTPSDMPSKTPSDMPSKTPSGMPSKPSDMPSTNPTVHVTTTTTTISEEESTTSGYDISAYFVVGCVILLPILFIIIAFLFHRKRPGSDRPGYISLFKFFASVGDFYTDAIWSLTLYSENNKLWIWAFLFTFGPHILSIFIGLLSITTWRQMKSKIYISEYASKFDKVIIILTLIAGFYAAVEILTSHLFHLDVLSLQISKRQRSRILNLKIINNVILENIPCVAIQYLYLTSSTGGSLSFDGLSVTLLAMVFSIGSITFNVLTIFTRLFNGCIDITRNNQLNSVYIDFVLKEDNKTNNIIKQYHVHTHFLLSEAIRFSLHVQQSQVIIIYIQKITDGIKVKAKIKFLDVNDTKGILNGLKNNQSELFINFHKECTNQLKIEPKNIILYIVQADTKREIVDGTEMMNLQLNYKPTMNYT